MEQLDNVDERLARLLETNVKSSTVQRSYTEEERKIRDAILSQYGQVCCNTYELFMLVFVGKIRIKNFILSSVIGTMKKILVIKRLFFLRHFGLHSF